MGSRSSRRALLRTAGVATVAGLAGCGFRRSGRTETRTLAPGQTYDIAVRNRISAANLRPAEDLPTDAPATVSVEVDANYRGRDDELLFGRSVELPPGGSRTFEDAFTTEVDGPEYVVSAAVRPLRDEVDPGAKMSLTSAHRFEPGEFQAPTSTTFYVTVRDGAQGNAFAAWVEVRDREPASEGSRQ